MALAGSLKEFGLADILQLIFYQKKTGSLMLKSRFDTVRLLFHEGHIVLAESSRRKVEGRLGRVLVRKGIMSNENLEKAVAECKETRKKLGHILIENGYANTEQIRQVLTDQITELIVQLFTWKEGNYEFTPGAVPLDSVIPLRVDTQGLMMESLRIFDEWSVFKGRIDQGTVLVRTTKPEQGLSRDKAELLKYVDGQNDVNRIAALYGQDAFHTAKDLLQLMDMGLVAPREAGVPGEEEFPRDSGPAEIPGLKAIVTLMILISLGLAVAGQVLAARADLGSFRASEEVDRLRYEIEIQKELTAAYPAMVEEVDPWGTPYVYEPAPQGFVVFSAGPDRVAGTADDVY
ncbi:MAG: DUF4388 domain-containing protein [Nitrospirota bacterium]|jgi:hypothetical protein